MKLTYLENGSPDCPLIMLSEFDSEDIVSLQEYVRKLVSGELSSVDLHCLPGINAEQNVQLSFASASSSRGVVGNAPEFVCELTPDRWENVEGLLEPFTEVSDKPIFQWLDESGGVALLISSSGNW